MPLQFHFFRKAANSTFVPSCEFNGLVSKSCRIPPAALFFNFKVKSYNQKVPSWFFLHDSLSVPVWIVVLICFVTSLVPHWHVWNYIKELFTFYSAGSVSKYFYSGLVVSLSGNGKNKKCFLLSAMWIWNSEVDR